MTDERIEPDAVVQTALRLLPIPDHEAGFWTRLAEALDDEPTPGERTRGAEVGHLGPGDDAGVVDLVPTHHLGVVPPALRRRSNVVISAVAVAAAVVVVVAAATLVRDRNGDRTPATEQAEAGDGTAPTPTSSDSEGTGDAATTAVLTWIDAIAEGDVDTSWSALGPASQRHWGSKEDFEDERSGLAEGYGAWSAADPDVMVTSLDSGADDLVVVTLVGSVEREGHTEHRADAFPVRVVDGEARVELYARAGELELVVPQPVGAGGTRPVVEDDALIIVVPEGVEAPIVRLDEGDPLVCGETEGTELQSLGDAPGQRCELHPEGGIPAGDRVLTVAFLSPDRSRVTAQSVLFEAA